MGVIMVFDAIDLLFAGLARALRFVLGLDAEPANMVLVWMAWIFAIAAAVVVTGA